MEIQFSSCQDNYVLEFLKSGYPSSEVTWEKLPKLREGIRKDIVRITDPSYHPLALVTGSNYKDINKNEMMEIAKEIQSL